MRDLLDLASIAVVAGLSVATVVVNERKYNTYLSI
jgi:hypothetical protein